NTNSAYVTSNGAALPGAAGAACGQAGPPAGKFPVVATWAADAGWSALDFQIDEPNLFTYTYTGGTTVSQALAIGDLDCDGTKITYTLDMTAPSGNATALITEPPPNSD
ncbi:MAG: hypothetical protein NT062_03135, partial [Proteobacteria bacterium]|nr:hypothetical protein [Pseudomonadota bacterium]